MKRPQKLMEVAKADLLVLANALVEREFLSGEQVDALLNEGNPLGRKGPDDVVDPPV